MSGCPSDNSQAIDQSSFWDFGSGPWDKHRIGWLVAGICSVVVRLGYPSIKIRLGFKRCRRRFLFPSLVLCNIAGARPEMYLLFVSLTYDRLWVQKLPTTKGATTDVRAVVLSPLNGPELIHTHSSLRILYLPPVYAIISFFSYRYFRQYTYYSLIQVGAFPLPIFASPYLTLCCSLRGLIWSSHWVYVTLIDLLIPGRDHWCIPVGSFLYHKVWCQAYHILIVVYFWSNTLRIRQLAMLPRTLWSARIRPHSHFQYIIQSPISLTTWCHRVFLVLLLALSPYKGNIRVPVNTFTFWSPRSLTLCIPSKYALVSSLQLVDLLGFL